MIQSVTFDKLFQSIIVLGKKLFWKYVVDVDGGIAIYSYVMLLDDECAACNESMR